MEQFTTDEQQIDAVKKWWSENGAAIALGVVIGLGAIFGWRGWQAHIKQEAEAASDIYQVMISSSRTQDYDQVKTQAQQLLDEYPSTTYAVFAAMSLAKFAIQDEDFAAAKQHLGFAIDHAGQEELALLAKLRLARVLFAEGDLDGALAQLQKTDFREYTGNSAELKGDILFKQGDLKAAYEAYTLALATSSPGTDQYSILEMKLDAVGRPTL